MKWKFGSNEKVEVKWKFETQRWTPKWTKENYPTSEHENHNNTDDCHNKKKSIRTNLIWKNWCKKSS
jgi:hypothetical protein